MKLIEPSYQIEQAPPYHDMLAVIEKAARTCYQSWDKIKDGSAEKLIKHCIARGHFSVIEHCAVTVRIICNRGVSHEIVRHRLASFSQESTRYVKYDDIEIIKPVWWNRLDTLEAVKILFCQAMEDAEQYYKTMIATGHTAQDAREILPNAVKTEIVVTANLREWRHIFKLRTSKAAHPEMRRIMCPMLADFADRWPVFFGDIEED